MAKYLLKRSVLKALLAGAFLFPQMPSHAGVWVLYQYWHGIDAIYAGEGSTAGGALSVWDLTFSPSSHPLYDPSGISVDPRYQGYWNTKVQTVSELHWSPNTDSFGNQDPFDVPPARICVLVRAGAGGWEGNYGTAQAITTASDGLGDIQTVQVDANQGLTSVGFSSSGSRLMTIDNTARLGVVSLPTLELDASVTIPVDPDVNPNDHSAMIVSVSRTDKVVTALISSDIEPSFKKTMTGSPPVPTREPNVRNDDGSMTVDTVTQWTAPTLLQDGYWTAGCRITGTQDALQSPSYHWSTTSNLTAIPDLGFQYPIDLSAIRDASFTLVYSNNFPENIDEYQPASLNLTITDADGNIKGSLDNTYAINFHVPYEYWHQWKADEPPVQQDVTLTVAAPGFANENGGISMTYQFDDALWADFSMTSGAYIFSTLGAAPNPIWAGLFSLLGIAFQNAVPVQNSASVNFNDCWNDPDSLFNPLKSANISKRFYQMTPRMQVGYVTHNMEADNYDFHGYVGQVRKGVAQWDNSLKFTGDFVQINTTNNGGPPDVQTSPAPLNGNTINPVPRKK